MAHLLLAEHDYQVEDLLARSLAHAGAEWVALGPSAMACLDRHGIRYGIPEDFNDETEFGAECEDIHEALRALCTRADARLGETDTADAFEVQPFLFNLFPLVVLTDALRVRLCRLDAVVRTFPRHRPVIHRARPVPWNPADVLFSSRETLWGAVAALPGWRVAIDVLEDPAAPRRHRGSRGLLAALLRDAAARLAARSLFWATAVRCQAEHDYRPLADLFCRRQGSTLLVLNARGEWVHTAPWLRAEGWRILFAGENDLLPRQRAWPTEASPRASRILEEVEASPIFRRHGVCFHPLLAERLRWVAVDFPGECRAAARRLEEWVSRYDVRVIGAAGSVTGRAHAITQAARRLGVSVLTWQHGFVVQTGACTSQLNDHNDRLTCNATLVYGAAVESSYRGAPDRLDGEPIAVGSASLDALRVRTPTRWSPGSAGRLRVVYATTNYCQNHWYCGFLPPWSDARLYRDQVAVVGALARMSAARRIELVVKLHPAVRLGVPPWARALAGARDVRLVHARPSFPGLLADCDSVILDFPSTTLLQAISAGRPVFVLLRHLELPADARAMLGRRVVCAADASELIAHVQRFVASGRYPADLDDDTYLRLYGTHLDDGLSARRAADLVRAASRAERVGGFPGRNHLLAEVSHRGRLPGPVAHERPEP